MRFIHRDLGYIFFAMSVIYGVSGIAINHLNDWDPNYDVEYRDVKIEAGILSAKPTKKEVLAALNSVGETSPYKKHIMRHASTLKVFIKNGSMIVDLNDGWATIEKIQRRPILHAMNYLHYNPGNWWTLFSDIFAVALVLMAITGLFMIKGKNGIKRRGAWLTVLGIIIPILFLVLFYS